MTRVDILVAVTGLLCGAVGYVGGYRAGRRGDWSRGEPR